MTRRAAAAFAAAVLAFATPVAAQAGMPGKDPASQRLLLKKWSLARCLARAFPDGPMRDDALAVAGGYLEFGTAPVEAYKQLDALADRFLARELSGSVAGKFQTMKCIDLYGSRELDRAVAAIVRSERAK